MKKQLLEQYNLRFYKKYVNVWKRYSHSIEGDGEIAWFLVTLNDNDDIIPEGLANCDIYLAGKGPLSSDGDGIISENSSVNFTINGEAHLYSDQGSPNPTQIMPLQDFRDILQMWYDFLKT